MLAGFGRRPFAAELRLFKTQASALRRLPFTFLRLANELGEVSMFRRRHFSSGELFVDRAFHSGQPGGITGGTSGAQRSNQRQVIVLHSRRFRTTGTEPQCGAEQAIAQKQTSARHD